MEEYKQEEQDTALTDSVVDRIPVAARSSCLQRSTSALIYKTTRLQAANPSSTLCQLLTPLLCIAFTLAVRSIADGFTTGKVQGWTNMLIPMHMPIIEQAVQSGARLNCYEGYLYQVEEKDKDTAQKLLKHVLKKYCQGSKTILKSQNQSIIMEDPSESNKEQSQNKESPQDALRKALDQLNEEKSQDKDDELIVIDEKQNEKQLNLLKNLIQGEQKKRKLLQSNRSVYPQQDYMVPKFTSVQSVSKQLLSVLQRADHSGFERGTDANVLLQDGYIRFHSLSTSNLSLTLGINDWRLPQYHSNNGVTKLSVGAGKKVIVSYLRVTQGMMSLIEKITRAYLQQSHPRQIISGSFMYMPFSGEDRSLMNRLINVLGSGLYPLALSLLLPLLLYSIVSQKEEKLILMMKMNGMDMRSYWTVFGMWGVIMSVLVGLILFVVGRFLVAIPLFTDTNPAIIFLVFCSWAVAQVSMTVLVQTMIDNAKTAAIVGYLLSIFSMLSGETISTVIYPYPQAMPSLLLMFPPFALCRAIMLIGTACASSSCLQSLSHDQGQLIKCIIFLFMWSIAFIAYVIIRNKLETEGISLSTLIKRCYTPIAINAIQIQSLPIQMESQPMSTIIDISEVTNIDLSVQNHKIETKRMNLSDKPLIILQLSKQYNPDSPPALHPTTFHLQSGEIFGLLGANGAGKTTLISLLTGMLSPSSGSAYINGQSINASNNMIGVCPQFDLLWKELTVEEHLIFYAKLKGVEEEAAVALALRDVDLLDQRSRKTKELSGGMQRRLSLAIALIGNPIVVFMDEPSSGLDPSHRRQMWDILLKCKRRTSILLTTHLMQEAQTLCDRVAIINKGKLQCIGPLAQLKQKFSSGYRLIIDLNDDRLMQMNDTASIELLKSIECIKRISTLLSRDPIHEGYRAIFNIDKKEILGCIGELKKEKEIKWMIGRPSLYDVFVRFTA